MPDSRGVVTTISEQTFDYQGDRKKKLPCAVTVQWHGIMKKVTIPMAASLIIAGLLA